MLRWLPVLIVLLTVGCKKEAAYREYEVRGRYLGAAFGGQAMVVDHERIPGYMEAMRMTLRVERPELLSGLRDSAFVRFRLRVSGDEALVTELAALPDSTSPR